jgi:Skp family chaperone for outer membrane proteins
MKPHRILNLALLTLLVQFSWGQKATRVGFIDTDYILSRVASYIEMKAEISGKIEVWNSEIERRRTELKVKQDELNAQRDFLPLSIIEQREIEIGQLSKALFQYELDRFGPDGDLFVTEVSIVRPIQDLIYGAVQEIAKARNFDIIFDKSIDLVMLYFDNQLDISDLVIRKLEFDAKLRVVGMPKESEVEEIESEAEEKREIITEELNKAQQTKEEEKKARLSRVEKQREERRKAYISKREAVLKARAERQKLIEEKRKDTIN